MSPDKRAQSRITSILEKMSLKYGYIFILNHDDADAGFIELPDGRRIFFTYGTLDINTSAAIEFANNKALSSSILKEFGIRLLNEQLFKCSLCKDFEKYVSELSSSIEFLGFPVILKPIYGKQGRDIFKIDFVQDLNLIGHILWASKEDILIQEYINAEELRIVVLDGEVIQAYTRDFPHILGDGSRSIQELIDNKNRYFSNRNRNTKIDINDEQIKNLLAKKKYTLDTILTKDERFNLSYGRNLSKGGDYDFIEDKLTDEFKRILNEMAQKTGLRLVGFDLFVFKDPAFIKNKNEIACIEYNASPDMENNFYYDEDYGNRLEIIYERLFNALVRL